MKKYTNYHDLYNHMVRSFYLGEYHKGDRFPTQVELVSHYHVAANSIKKIFRLLLNDGFITTDRSFGTHVTFDIDNPDHLAKVPLHRPDPQGNDMDTLIVPSQFITYTLYHGLTLATPEQLQDYISHVEALLQQLQKLRDLSFFNNSLFAMVYHNLDNRYLGDFGNFLTHEFIFVGRAACTDPALREQVRVLGVDFYTQMLQLLHSNDLQPIFELVPAYYRSLYRLPWLFVFATPERNQKLFAQHALYTQLMHKLLLFIVASDLRQGDMLPTEQDIAEQYNVSIITVRKALSMLKEIGLVDGERFVGTRMLEDWNSPRLQSWLSSLLTRQHKMISDSIFAEYVLGRLLQNSLCRIVDNDLICSMQQALAIQWEAHKRYNAPLFMSQVFSAPAVSVIDSPLLTRCFYYVHDDLTKFLAIRLLQMSKGFDGTAEVYGCAQRAIDALCRRDFPQFLLESDAAVLRNWELMSSAIDETIYRCAHPQA